jgi:pimeloyl-ACP methyl ester carboxylesterase
MAVEMWSSGRRLLMGAAVGIWLGAATMAGGDDTAPAGARSDDGKAEPGLNMKTKTLGGRQFWGDVAYYRGWRIQHCTLDGHYRVIDPQDVRHAWGTLDTCRQELARLRAEHKLPPMEGKAVIVVHGIVRSSKSFGKMQQRLGDDGYVVVGFDYPSTRVTITDSAEYLHRVIESLEGIDHIDFVVHSLGGLIVRAYLAQHQDPRIRRMVMLGVPNQGAGMANFLKDYGIFKLVFGPAGQQLIHGEDGLIAGLPAPEFEFAIIAGARGTPDGWNPLIAGDDDGTVELENTKLPGAADFMTVPALHSFLMFNDDVIAATRRFLKEGALREGEKKEPIPRSEGLPSPGREADSSRAQIGK